MEVLRRKQQGGGVRNEEQGGVQGANGKETPILARTMRHRDGFNEDSHAYWW